MVATAVATILAVSAPVAGATSGTAGETTHRAEKLSSFSAEASSAPEVTLAKKYKGKAKTPYYKKKRVRSYGVLKSKRPKGWKLCISLLMSTPTSPPGQVAKKCAYKRKVKVSTMNWCAPFAALLTLEKKGQRTYWVHRTKARVICR
ncbi:hypothetical protein [Streptomyces qinglanensis]|nr:hypothetical protein [Streptomyces qinglanensis]